MRIKALIFYIYNRLMQLTIPMNPSHHGEECPYNGESFGFECCCDECDYYLICYPDWKDSVDYLFHQ